MVLSDSQREVVQGTANERYIIVWRWISDKLTETNLKSAHKINRNDEIFYVTQFIDAK